MVEGSIRQLGLHTAAAFYFFSSILRYDVPSSVGRGGGGATGLYSTAGLAGLLTDLISFFFGFFFSRLRLSRLPINFFS